MDLKIVFELLKEVREDQKQHGIELAKQSAFLQNMDADVRDLKSDVRKNTEDISHHIKRTDILQALHQDNQKKIDDSQSRIAKLEEPVKAKEWIKKHMITLSAIITALTAIAALVLEHYK